MLPTRNPCQDPAGNRTTRRPPDHRKETQTAVVWTYLPFIRSGQNHLTRLSETEKKIRQTEEEVGRQHQEIDRLGVRQVPEGSGEEKKKCSAPTTPQLRIGEGEGSFIVMYVSDDRKLDTGSDRKVSDER